MGVEARVGAIAEEPADKGRAQGVAVGVQPAGEGCGRKVVVANVATTAGAVTGILRFEVAAAFDDVVEEGSDGGADDGAFEVGGRVVFVEGDVLAGQGLRPK